tara:strand:+ start:424 stop:810 length:387 start_codon:yes stop_codon:yes gene_type:complete
MKKALFLVLLVSTMPALAHDQWYDCDVQEFYVLSDDGRLEARTEGYAGESFRVDRDASVISGDKINSLFNIDIVASNPVTQGVYSLVNYSRRSDGQIRRLLSLTVQDFSAIKPFVLAEGNYIFTGICR